MKVYKDGILQTENVNISAADLDLMLGTDFSAVFGAASLISGTPAVKVEQQGTVTVDGSGVTQPISAASLPLPSGAATSANQLADGHNVTIDNISSNEVFVRGSQAAGSPVNNEVVTIQGIASMTPVIVDLGANNDVTTSGNVADDATTPQNPVMVGGSAKSPDGTDPTSVAENDVVRFQSDLNRRQYVNTRHARTWSYHNDGSSALTDASVQADPGDGFQIVITEIVFSSGTATAINIFFEEGSSKILGPWYLEAVAGRGLVWRGEKKVTASTAVTVTTSAGNAQSIDVQGYIQAV